MLKSKEVSSATDNSSRQGLKLLISSRDAQALKDLQEVCEHVPGLQVTAGWSATATATRCTVLSRCPTCCCCESAPSGARSWLHLMQRPAAERPGLLVCGALDQAEGLRLAMQAGARDFLPRAAEFAVNWLLRCSAWCRKSVPAAVTAASCWR